MRMALTRTALVAVVLTIVLAVCGCAGADPVPDDEAFDPVAPSGPSESVVRAVRLAGFEGVIVGNDRNGAVVRLALPSIDSAADVELAWQTGLASLVAAFPKASEYGVQVTSDREFLEMRIDGRAAREAVENDDAAAVREEAEFTFLGDQAEAQDLPASAFAADSDEMMLYIDAKNRATGLLGDTGVDLPDAATLATAAEMARAAVPGIPAPEAGEDAGRLWASRASAELMSSLAEGSDELAQRLSSAPSGMDREDVKAMREWFHVVSAVESGQSYGSVLALTHSVALAVSGSEVPDGPEADAVLVAFGDRDAPRSAAAVRRFERVESADTSGTGAGEQLPDIVVAANGGESAVIAYLGPSGVETVDTEAWLAHDRADGTRYWLAGEDGKVALTDGSLRGWAFAREQAALVDALDVGTWLEVFPTQ